MITTLGRPPHSQALALISADHFVHIPRHFFNEHYGEFGRQGFAFDQGLFPQIKRSAPFREVNSS